jgi:amino acid transporter
MSHLNEAGTIGHVGHLRGKLGFWSLLAVGVGLVVSQGVMVIMLQGAGFGGYGFLMNTLLAYGLALTYVFSFSELTLMFRSPGSLATFTEVAIGNFPAIVAVFSGYLVVAMFALSAELVLIELMLVEIKGLELPSGLLLHVLLAAFSILNIVGVDSEQRAKVGDALRGGISWRCSDAVNSQPRKGYATCQTIPSPCCLIHPGFRRIR